MSSRTTTFKRQQWQKTAENIFTTSQHNLTTSLHNFCEHSISRMKLKYILHMIMISQVITPDIQGT